MEVPHNLVLFFSPNTEPNQSPICLKLQTAIICQGLTCFCSFDEHVPAALSRFLINNFKSSVTYLNFVILTCFAGSHLVTAT